MTTQFRGLAFERIGHASVKIRLADGRRLYIDPWSEVLAEHHRDDAAVVFVTHDDSDHYDPEAIDLVSSDETVVAAYESIDVSALDREVVPLPYEGSTTVAGIDVRTIPAYNRASGAHVDADGHPFHDEGEVIGLLLTVEGTTIYYPSDTDFLPVHESLSADVFLPPIGGHYTMDRDEAVRFARELGPELVLPVHYDTFDAITTDAKAFASTLEREGIPVVLF